MSSSSFPSLHHRIVDPDLTDSNDYYECAENLPYIDSVSSSVCTTAPSSTSDYSDHTESTQQSSPHSHCTTSSTGSTTSNYASVKTQCSLHSHSSTSSQRGPISLFTEEHCRICLDTEGPLTRPCRCRGTMGSVHHDCLAEWLRISGRETCELCSVDYKYKMKIKPLREWSGPDRMEPMKIAKITCQTLLAILSLGYAIHMTSVISGAVKSWAETGGAIKQQGIKRHKLQEKFNANKQRWHNSIVIDQCILNLICGRLGKDVDTKSQYPEFIVDVAKEKLRNPNLQYFILNRMPERYHRGKKRPDIPKIRYPRISCNGTTHDANCIITLKRLSKTWHAMKSNNQSVILISAHLNALGTKMVANGFEMFFAIVVLLVMIYFGLICLSSVFGFIKSCLSRWIAKNSVIKVSEFKDIEVGATAIANNDNNAN